MKGLLLEQLHAAPGIDPVADAFAGTVTSDVYNMKNAENILFVLYIGVGATGTSTITVLACDDVVPTTTSAIPFWYREITTGDTHAAATRVAATGFTTTAGSSKIILVEASADDMGGTGYGYVQLSALEVVNSPVLGGVMAILGNLRNMEDATPTVLT